MSAPAKLAHACPPRTAPADIHTGARALATPPKQGLHPGHKQVPRRHPPPEGAWWQQVDSPSCLNTHARAHTHRRHTPPAHDKQFRVLSMHGGAERQAELTHELY